MKELNENISTLVSFLTLKDNLNKTVVSSFSPNHIGMCLDFIADLKYQPNILPTSDASVQFEYELKNGRYLKFNLYNNGKIIMFYKSEAGFKEVKYYTYPIDALFLNEEIEMFFGVEPYISSGVN